MSKGLSFGFVPVSLDRTLAKAYTGLPLRISALFISFLLLAPNTSLVAEESSTDQLTTKILDGYLSAAKGQESALRGVKMDMEIEAQLPKLQKQGKMEALRKISKVGLVVYDRFKFSGDTTIKKDVIARYLEAEQQARDLTRLAIIPTNYKFKYKGEVTNKGRLAYVFQVSPRKKLIGLFKGELWLDEQTYLPVREAGRFVKNPSVFLKKVEFVREYEIRNGISIPRHIESVIDTRLVGPAQLSINFSNFSRDDEDDQAAIVPVSISQ
jgi:hypothetical protein